MKDAYDLHKIFLDAIDGKVWQTGEDKLACVRFATGSSIFGEVCE